MKSGQDQSAPMARPWPWQELLFAAALTIAVFLAYLPCINGAFIWDDNDIFITDNQLTKAPDGLYRFWCTTEPFDYWPITNTTFWIEWRLWGMNSTGYHVTNLIFHALETLLIWIILRNLSVPGAFLAGLIFALHPVGVESVAWISERKDMAAVLFFLFSILWYLKAERSGTTGDSSRALSHGGPWEQENHSSFIIHHSSFYSWYWLSLTAFLLAMLSKGSVAVLPVLLLGFVWYLRPLTWRDLLRTAPFFAIALVCTVLNVWFQRHGSKAVIRNADFIERLLGAGWVVWFYLYKAFLPLNLTFVYPQVQIKVDNLLCWLPLFAATVVTIVLWLYRNGWSRPLLVAWGFFCVALVPVLGLTDVYFMQYSLVADHYQHIALIGVAALAAAAFSMWRRRARADARWAIVAVPIMAVGALICLTYRQSGIYKDEITLYKDTLKKNPDCWMVHTNLGAILYQNGKIDEGIEHYKQSIKIYPNDAEAHNNLGVALSNKGQVQEAIEYFKQALHLRPDYPEAYNNLGLLLLKTGQMQEAIENFQYALRINPYHVKALNNLGSALAQTGRPKEAIELYRRALALRPDSDEIHINLSDALIQTGQFQEAIEHCQQALRLKPDSVEAQNTLGSALLRTNMSQEAIEHFQEALRLKPDSVEAHFNLGNAFKMSGRYEQAIEHYEKALQINADFHQARVNLAGVLVQAGRPQEAIEHCRQALRQKPDYPEAHYFLGSALVGTNMPQEAIEHFQEALRLKPDYPEVCNNLGVTLLQIGKPEEAVVQLKEALRLRPDYISAYYNLALAYADAGQSSEAEAAAQKGLELARSKGQTILVGQFEKWLDSYRAGLSSPPSKTPPTQSAAPP